MSNIFTRDGLISFLITLPALLISLSIHEFAHAWTAYKLGDTSQKIRGRLTLDPFKHIDLFGFIAILLFHVGWGKPVMIDDRNFKNRGRDSMLVALAGPVSNILLAVIVTFILKAMYMCGFLTESVGNIMLTLANILFYTIVFNVIFAVFNLIPLPPLDGSKVLTYILPQKLKGIMYTLEKYSVFIILILWCTDITSIIITPAYDFLFGLLMKILSF